MRSGAALDAVQVADERPHLPAMHPAGPLHRHACLYHTGTATRSAFSALARLCGVRAGGLRL
ncbi:MAG TPA: hypothetical protein VFM77_12325, partial [Terriglobales bacterium]|nr:hypothetical protein [Terriglobales bacterium]